MAEVITDTKTLTVTVIQHANCEILNLTYPTIPIEPGSQFNIMYDCKNNGADDTCYGTLFKTGDINTVYNHWEEDISGGAFKSVFIDFPNGITEDLNATLYVGYIN